MHLHHFNFTVLASLSPKLASMSHELAPLSPEFAHLSPESGHLSLLVGPFVPGDGFFEPRGAPFER